MYKIRDDLLVRVIFFRQKVANGNVQEGPRNQSFENSYVPNKELLRRNVPHLPPINISHTKNFTSQ